MCKEYENYTASLNNKPERDLFFFFKTTNTVEFPAIFLSDKIYIIVFTMLLEQLGPACGCDAKDG